MLLTAWRKLILDYADRFMIGSDPVWPVDKGFGWDEPDSGWERLQDYISFHRQWLSQLPPEVANQIRWLNAKTWFAQKNNTINKLLP